MIQFNLLPDVKITYIKANRTKRTAMLVASLISGISILVAVLMLTLTYGVQGQQIKSLDSKIAASKAVLNKASTEESLDKILTIQNQLSSVNELHEQKPVVSRLFDYLAQLTPSTVTISRITASIKDGSSMGIEGNAGSIETVNKFVDTLKFSTFKETPESSELDVFKNVVLKSFSKGVNGKSTYSLVFEYDPAIFSSKNDGKGLIVPNIVTTRSETERPILFEEPAIEEQGVER